MNPTLTLTYLLAGALLTNVLLKLWLNARQVRHVAQHRGEVPVAFASQISLADHQKAADYTLAKAKVSQIDILLDAALLVGWTLLGGLSALNALILEYMAPGLWQQVFLVLCFSLVGGLIDLPLSLYQTFVLEQKFGFNKMTWSLWLTDAFKGLLLGLGAAVDYYRFESYPVYFQARKTFEFRKVKGFVLSSWGYNFKSGTVATPSWWGGRTITKQYSGGFYGEIGGGNYDNYGGLTLLSKLTLLMKLFKL